MTTIDQLRRAALALPDVEEGTHFGMVAFSVRGKGFASVTKDGVVQLQMPADVTDRALAAHPTGERLVRMGSPIGFRVPLTDIGGKDLNALVSQAWRSRAPKRLAQRHTAASTPHVNTDLPTTIGKPATRALLRAGISSLSQVAEHSQAELLALHGVGPKTLRALQEHLEQQGQSMR